MLVARLDSPIVWAKRRDALRFVRFMIDLIPTPFLEESMKATRQEN